MRRLLRILTLMWGDYYFWQVGPFGIMSILSAFQDRHFSSLYYIIGITDKESSHQEEVWHANP